MTSPQKLLWVILLGGIFALFLWYQLAVGNGIRGVWKFMEKATHNPLNMRNNISLHKCMYKEKSPQCNLYLYKEFLVNLQTKGVPKNFIDIPKMKPHHRPMPMRGNKGRTDQKFSKSYFRKLDLKKPKELSERANKMPFNSTLRVFLRAQEIRKTLIKNVCTTEADQFLPMKQVPKSMVADSTTGLLFCPIYKSASSTWFKILFKISGISDKEIKMIQTQRILNRYYHWISNLAFPMTLLQTTKFLIVRHPMERLVSCFRDKFEFANKPYYYTHFGEKMIKYSRKIPSELLPKAGSLMIEAQQIIMAEGPNLDELSNSSAHVDNPFLNPVGPTFTEFLRYITIFNGTNEHWRPYYVQCNMCKLKFDFIIKFESLIEESKLFLSYLNHSSLPIQWKNPSGNGPTNYNITCSYISSIDDKLFDLVIKKYTLDFRLFDYSTNIYKNCTSSSIEKK